jgi:hypothetical protein
MLMGKFLFWVHIASWVGNIIIGARAQRRYGSTPPTPVCGMYVGGHHPIVAAFTVGAIPVVSTLFIIYAFYLWLKGEKV